MKKKVGVILLISLLVISSVFAASTFKGKVRLRLGAWNNVSNGYSSSNEWQYGFLDKSDAKVVFMLQELIGSSTGEGKIFGEVEAQASARLKAGNDVDLFDSEWYALKPIQYRLQFNKANIVFDKDKNFKLGIAGTWAQPRYAKGWEVELDNGNLIQSDPFFTYATAFEGKGNSVYYSAYGAWTPAVTLTYDKFAFSFTVSGGQYGNPLDDPTLVALFQANKLSVMEGMDISVAAGYMQSTKMRIAKSAPGTNVWDIATDTEGDDVSISIGRQRHILFGFGLDYSTDLVDFALGVNGNYALTDNPWVYDYANGFIDGNEKHGLEASINFAYKGDFKINFDAWYLDNLGLWADANTPDDVTYGNQFDLGYVYRRADGSLPSDSGKADLSLTLHRALSLKLAVQPIDMLGIALRGQDLLNQMIIGLDLPIYVNDAITITPSFEYTAATNKQYNTKGKDKGWSLNGATANAVYQGILAFNYKHDLFNLFASVRIGSETTAPYSGGKDGEKTLGLVHIRPYVKMSSDALVDNVILSFVWEKATFGNQSYSPAGKYYGQHDDGTQNFGDIYLEARINF